MRNISIMIVFIIFINVGFLGISIDSIINNDNKG